MTRVVERTVVEESVQAPAKPGEHGYGAKYATRSVEEGFGEARCLAPPLLFDLKTSELIERMSRREYNCSS